MGFKNKKTTGFVPIELNGPNVEIIFRRCLAEPCEGELSWNLELDERKVHRDRMAIHYLLGQLRSVHQGRYDFEYGMDMIRHYTGSVWSDQDKYDEQAQMLLRLGEQAKFFYDGMRDGKPHIWLNRSLVFATFAPKGPAFTDWWDIHEPYYQGQYLEYHGLDETPEDKQKIQDYYRQGAEKGDPWAQSKLATAYWYGIFGLPKDPAEAFRHYSFAAEAGIPDSCSRLAGCYASGKGTSQDYKAAIDWYYRAYKNGANGNVMWDFNQLAYSLSTKWREEKDRDLRLRYLKLAKDAMEKRIEFQKAIMDEPEGDFNPPYLTSKELKAALERAEEMLSLFHIEAALNGLEWR